MASKMSSSSPSNGGANTHGAIPKDTQAGVASNDSGQSFEPPEIDPVTLKRNPKMELSKPDLLKLLSCLEGELQARDVVIATLKNEKVKHMLCQARYGKLSLTDPVMALQRDSNHAKNQMVDEALIRSMADNQMASLENLILAQRTAQVKMAQYLRDAEARHAKAVQELEEEKAKHAHDTAQGDDVTYALEKERTRLKQELETEKQAKKKLEKELKKTTETLEEERNRQKHMVLLLLAERKKIITKYIEERKRSEDLTQILSEEKGRAENMAEGLEEESKKSLQMEAELERHMSDCANERQQIKNALAMEEKRYQELLSEHDKLQRECDRLKNQLSEAHQVAMFQANSMAGGGSSRYGSGPSSPRPGGPATLPPQLPSKPPVTTGVRPGTSTAASTLTPPKVGIRWAVSPVGGPPSDDLTAMAANITKAVQPTATVSSQPVSAPLTGVAYGVQPGVALRNVHYGVAAQPPPPSPPTSASSPSAAPEPARAAAGAPQVVRVTPRVSVTASPGTKVLSSSQPGKMLFHVTTPAAGAPPPNGAPPPALARKPPLGRGVPPPVPPNKPAVPPNKPAGGAAKPAGLARPEPAAQVGVTAAAAPAAAAAAAAAAGTGAEPLGPELANFQRMLVSMAGTAELEPPPPPLPTCPPPARTPSPPPLSPQAESPSSFPAHPPSSPPPSLPPPSPPPPPPPPPPMEDGCQPSGEPAVVPQPCSQMVAGPPPPDCDLAAAAAATVAAPVAPAAAPAANPIAAAAAASAAAPATAAAAAAPATAAAAAATATVSPLMVAIIRTDEDEVKRLLESSPDLTERAQDGNSLFHLAASVGSAGCLRLLLQKWQMVYMTTDMIPVLTEVNLSGSTVLHLAALRVSDQHLRTLVDYCPQLKLALRNQLATNLRQLASPECLRYLDSLGDSLERVCTVYIQCRLTSTRHVIGQVKVGASANWQWLTQSLFNLFIRHLQALHRAFSDERPMTLTRKERSRSDPFPDRGQAAALGLSPDAVDAFSAGSHRWRRPDPGSAGRSPHHTLCDLQVDELLVTLRPAEDAAYATALPLSVINNYVRLLEGHHALILDVPDGWDRELLGRAVLAALAAQQADLPLVRLPADAAASFPADAGPVLAHLDPVSSGAEVARRAALLPAGSFLLAAGPAVESDGVALPLLQLRPESAPLSALPGRRLMRRLLAAAGGVPPPPEDAVFRTCRWAAGLGGRLLAAAARRKLCLAAPGAEAWAAARVEAGEPWRLIRWVQRLWETEVVPAVAAALQDPAQLEETLVYLRDAAAAEDCPLSGTDRDYLLSSFETRPVEALPLPEPVGSPGKRARTPRHALRGLGPLLKKLPASPRHARDS